MKTRRVRRTFEIYDFGEFGLMAIKNISIGWACPISITNEKEREERP